MADVPDLLPPQNEQYHSSPNNGSPNSSIYSGSNHSPEFVSESFAPVEVQQPVRQVEKRRSWALPFKRQSTPDLSKIWKPSEHAQATERPKTTYGHTDLRQAPPTSAPSTSAPAQDPLLAAM